LVPELVTLRGIMALIFCIISPNSVALVAHFVKVVEDRPILCATKM